MTLRAEIFKVCPFVENNRLFVYIPAYDPSQRATRQGRTRKRPNRYPGGLPVTASPTVPSIRLARGGLIPQLGLGLLQLDEHTEAVVGEALAAGYRHFDTASYYRNEESLGSAIRGSGMARSEIFVTSKLWNTEQGRVSAGQALERSREKLRLGSIDLYLVHWPAPRRGLYLETWSAMQDMLSSGSVREIGVCNFQSHHLDELTSAGSIAPAVNQVELHPYFQQVELRAYHRERDIVTAAWRPLARGDVLGDSVLSAIANVHQVTPAQVVLRWHIQLGNVVIPKTVQRNRLRSNIDVFGFTLSFDEMERIRALDRGPEGRTGPHPDDFSGDVGVTVYPDD